MSKFVDLVLKGTGARAHRHVFYSWMPFFEWYNKLESTQEEISKFEDGSKVEVTMTRTIFEVGSVPPHYKFEKLCHTSVVAIACEL